MTKENEPEDSLRYNWAVDADPLRVLSISKDEMLRLVYSIEGFAALLQNEELRQDHNEYVKAIEKLATVLRTHLDAIAAYVEVKKAI
jgi:hypothetical protein